MTLPIDAVDRFAEELERGLRPREEDIRTFCLAWRRYRSGLSVAESFGLPGTTLAMKARNTALLDAARLLDHPDMSLYHLARDLRNAVMAFEARQWKRINQGAEPAGELERLLASARRANNAPLPSTLQRYLQIISDSGGFTAGRVKMKTLGNHLIGPPHVRTEPTANLKPLADERRASRRRSTAA